MCSLMSFELLWFMSPENMTQLYFSVYKVEVDTEEDIQTGAEVYQDIKIKV